MLVALVFVGAGRPVPISTGVCTFPILETRATEAFFEAHRRRDGTDSFALMSTSGVLDPAEVRSLAAKGISVLGYFADRVYRVRVSKEVRSMPKLEGRRADVCDPLPGWKISPRLTELASVPSSGPERERRDHSQSRRQETQDLVVLFYPSVEERAKRDALAAAGVEAAPDDGPLLGDVAYVKSKPGLLSSLALQNAVAWIEPGPGPSVPLMDAVRRQASIEAVQQFIPIRDTFAGLSGKGVVVAVFDVGIEDASMDFAGRVAHASPEKSIHGTHVAGVILGNGSSSRRSDSWGRRNAGSSRQWRGVAPSATLLEAYYQVPSYAEQLLRWRDFIIDRGLHLSNHSYMLGWDGSYGAAEWDTDKTIRGDQSIGGEGIPARLQIFSAGNQGMKPDIGHLNGFFSLTNQAKNALVVGNLEGTLDRVSLTSSLGPAHDGRVKPDVVAPGTCVKSVGYCRVGSIPIGADYCSPAPRRAEERKNFILEMSGTSVAAAVATGILALGLEAYFNGRSGPMPLPSTLRGAVIHTARDLVGAAWHKCGDGWVSATPGPDFATGFGAMDAAALTQLLRHRSVREDSIFATGHERVFDVAMPAGARTLKVTLAWDDPATDPAPPAMGADPTRSVLVNDLDLTLVAPDGTRHYPWQLDQTITDEASNVLADDQQRPGTLIRVWRSFLPATRPTWISPDDTGNVNDKIPERGLPAAVHGRDHLNNVEQVEVQSPIPGTWRIEVSGFRVASGPQTFSLVGAEFVPESLTWDVLSFCTVQRLLCRRLALDVLCGTRPELCSPRIVWTQTQGFRLSLSAPEKVVIPVYELCAVAARRLRTRCSPGSVSISGVRHDIGLSLASADGGRVKPLRVAGERAEVTLAGVDPQDAFLVFQLSDGSPSSHVDLWPAIELH